MQVTSAAVFANEKKDAAKKTKEDVLSYLRARGVSLDGRPNLAITIGGDGTVLYNKEHYGVPYFAIGSKSSFICQADFSNWKYLLSRALTRMEAEERLLLECSIDGKRMPLCLNEIGIRNPEPRVLSIHLAIGKKHHAFRADGVIFSTPTGSRAYCYSCGGKEMKKNDTRYQVAAISPFRRLFSPAIVGGKTECVLRMGGGERAQFFIDGQDFGFFGSGNTLRVKASKTKFLFAKV